MAVYAEYGLLICSECDRVVAKQCNPCRYDEMDCYCEVSDTCPHCGESTTDLTFNDSDWAIRRAEAGYGE